MLKKAKGTKYCPSDYDNANQSDSDHPEDPDYIYEEPASPKISQVKSCDTYRKRQEEKNKKSTATPKRTKGGQTSPSTPKRTKGGQTSPATPLSPVSETSDAGKRKRA